MREARLLAFLHGEIFFLRRNGRQSICVDESERGNECLLGFLWIEAFLAVSLGLCV